MSFDYDHGHRLDMQEWLFAYWERLDSGEEDPPEDPYKNKFWTEEEYCHDVD